MGIETSDLDPNGPFTKDEAMYINSRQRLREVLRANGTLHLIDEENWVDEDGNPVEPEVKQNTSIDASEPVTSTPESRGRVPEQRPADPTEPVDNAQTTPADQPDPFVPVDRSEWTNKALEDEIAERNEKIVSFNEEIEDESEHWATLPSGKGKNKDELLGILAQHDRFIYDTKTAPGGDDADDPDADTSGD